MSGKSIKPNIPSTEVSQLPPVNKPNEEIQMDFIGPISEKNQKLYILLSMDRFSKRPAASLCKTTDGQTAVRFLEQYINLNGIPKTIRTDKATAFTGRTFRVFCKIHQIKLIYGTPYIHTPTGLVERGVRTLKETLLTKIKAGDKFGKALDIALEIMRKTPHTRLKKSAFELHYGREPNTEISNMLNLDALKTITNSCISAKPDTLQVYSFSGAGGASDQLPMKTKKGAKGVSKYPFLFLEKKINKPKFESVYSDKTQIAISGTKHTITTSDNKILHGKHISKPISEIVQENNTNRGTGPRGPDGPFTKSPRIANVQDSDSDHGEASPVATATATTTFGEQTTPPPKYATIGRGRPKLIRDRQNSGSPGETLTSPDQQSGIGPLTVVTENMTDAEIDRVIEDARKANTELHLKDNGKVIQNNYQSPKGGEEDNVE